MNLLLDIVVQFFCNKLNKVVKNLVVNFRVVFNITQY